MQDPRMERLAQGIVEYSLAVKPGERVLIDLIDDGEELGPALMRHVYAAGGVPFINVTRARLLRGWIMGATDAQLETWYEHQMALMTQMQCYVAVRGAFNSGELRDVPSRALQRYYAWYNKLHLQQRVRHTRWCVLRYPGLSMAQQSDMSQEGFEDYYYRACAMDYRVLSHAMDPLKAAMDRARSVCIVGPGTDLQFSIEDIEAGKCDGHANIPDGECCMNVVRDSVNGRISYNIPSLYQGYTFRDIALTFRDGKVVDAVSNDIPRMNAILDTDSGARYIGEFAIGVHPMLTRHIVDTLFDEKMIGSLHFTPGGLNDDGTPSVIHWDIILAQSAEYGGGEIWFDGELIRKDGIFVREDLLELNPEPMARKLGY